MAFHDPRVVCVQFEDFSFDRCVQGPVVGRPGAVSWQAGIPGKKDEEGVFIINEFGLSVVITMLC